MLKNYTHTKWKVSSSIFVNLISFFVIIKLEICFWSEKIVPFVLEDYEILTNLSQVVCLVHLKANISGDYIIL